MVSPTNSPLIPHPRPNDDHSMTMRQYLQELTAPPAQTLRTLQPTSTTISYTVSTRSIPRTVSSRVLYYVGILLRVGLGVTTTLLLWLKWRTANEKLYLYEGMVIELLKSWRIDGLAEACHWRYLIPGAMAILFLVFRRNYTGTSPHSQISTVLAFNTNNRRVSDCPSWPRHPNLHHVLYVPTDAYDTFHTHDEHTGHLHTRGF